MKKTFLTAVFCAVIAVMLLSVCSVSAQTEVFGHYEKKDYEPHMPPLDLNPIRFYVQDNYDGTYTLTMTIKNVTNRDWPAGRYDLLCKRGSNYLAEGSGPRWTLDKDVPRGMTIEVEATLTQYVPMGRMVFYIMDGDTSFSGFFIRL